MLSYHILETNYLHLLWPDPSTAPRLKRIYNLPRNRAEFGVDHSFLWKNLQRQRGKKACSTHLLSEGWERRAVPGSKHIPGTPLGAGPGPGPAPGAELEPLRMLASPLRCLPTIWGCSVWALGILWRILHFRELGSEDDQALPSAEKWLPVPVLSLPLHSAFIKAWREDFLVQYLKHILAFNHSFYALLLIVLLHLCLTRKTKTKTKNTYLYLQQYR